MSCRSVKFGRFTVDATAGCFLQGAGRSKGLVVSGNELELNGVRIVPDAGAKIVIDPKALRLDTIGDVRVIVSAPGVGDVVLWHGQIHRDLSKAVPGANLFEFPAGAYKAEVLGFDLAADIPVRLDRDGVRIPVDLTLPKAFGGFTGHAELIAKKGAGLQVDSLKVHIGPVPLGALIVKSIDIAYTGAGDVWDGKGSVTVPAGGTLDASVRFEMGDFKQATISYTPTTPIPIGPFVYLLSIGGAFGVDPVHIAATARFGAGAAVNGQSPVNVDGKFEMTFPPGGAPAHFKLSGTVSVFVFQVGDGFLEFYTDGYAAFGGHVGTALGPLTVDARMNGFVDATTGQFGADFKGKVELCIKVGPARPCGSAGGDAAVSTAGFAACAVLDPPDPVGQISGGIRYPWSDFNPAIMANPVVAAVELVRHIQIPCTTDGYHVPPPRSLRKAQAGGFSVELAAGLPTATIAVEGDGGPPDVSVRGPDGTTFSSGQPGAKGFVSTVDGVNAAYVVLERPAAGTWTVTPNDGSRAIKQLLVGDGYKQASVSAKLGGKGRRRAISYQVRDVTEGQSIRFAERGEFGTRLLRRLTQRRGTIAFTPVEGRGRKRTIVALIEKDGIVVDEVKVGSFTAPGPARPGAPSGLRARRRGTTVTVTWRPGKGASQQVVRLRGRHTNLARLVPGKTKKAMFTAVRRDERVTIEVRGRSRNPVREGPRRTAPVGAAR